MKQRENLLERMTSAVDLGTEPIPKLPLVELAGHKRALIENHSGVTQYSMHEICVKVRFGQIRILGNGLTLSRMTKEQLIIIGDIESVSLCKERS